MSGQSWIIGATSDCDIVINQPTVSSRHCQLMRTPEGTSSVLVAGVSTENANVMTRIHEMETGLSLQLPSKISQSDPRLVPVGKSIQRFIEDPLSDRILMGEFMPGCEIEIDVDPDEEQLMFKAVTPSEA